MTDGKVSRLSPDGLTGRPVWSDQGPHLHAALKKHFRGRETIGNSHPSIKCELHSQQVTDFGGEPPANPLWRVDEEDSSRAMKCHYKPLTGEFYWLVCCTTYADVLVNLRNLL